MTTLRLEVGRFGTNAKEVAEWLEKAPGCYMNRFWVEIDPEAHTHVPIEELKARLEELGIQVDLVPWPPPPPLPFSARVKSAPRRFYFWLRRVFLRETFSEQLGRLLYTNDRIADLSTRESPMMRKLREDAERGR